MAAISFSVSRGTSDSTFAAGSQSVTVGTSAPGAGDVELRLGSTALGAGLTRREVEELLRVIKNYMYSSVYNAGSGAGWPGV